jgi:RHS repeat-associated protein
VSGAANMSLAYDPLGRLRQTVSTATTQFLYDGDRLSAEYDGAGTLLRRYVHGPGTDEPIVWYEGSGASDRRYLITDHQGSVIAAAGASTTRYAYGPYGEPDTWSGSRFRYTGQAALPEVALYHYKARVYDPVLGRFLQTDPIGYEDGLNWYAYVNSDPMAFTDPSGRQATLAIGVEEEVVLLTGPPPSPSHGAGLYANLTGDKITYGTYKTERTAAGQDTSASLVVSGTLGDVDNDFAGESTTGEADMSGLGVAGTLEGGQTSTGRLTGSLEIGLGPPGGSVGDTTTTVLTKNEVDISDAVDSAKESVREVGRQIMRFVSDPAGALGMPGNRRQEGRSGR